EELPHHADDRLHDGVTLDEDDADNVLLVAGHEDGVIAHEDADRRLVGDLPELHRLHDDRVPPLVTDPFGVAAFGVPVENCHDAVVAQDAFDFAVGHVIPGVGDTGFLQRLFRSVNRAYLQSRCTFSTHMHTYSVRGAGAAWNSPKCWKTPEKPV